MLADMMCIAINGRSAADATFRLGKSGDTPLRVSRPDNKSFEDDDTYRAIDKNIQALREVLHSEAPLTPWETKLASEVNMASTALTHPLGGCRMADNPAHGVCDAFGRVYNTSPTNSHRPYYEGLYIADAALVPSALGVNPSLTISAIALRAVQEWIAKDLKPVNPTTKPPPNS